MNNLFESATLKLTGWYLVILMVLSLLFSAILFQIASTELRRSLRAPVHGVLFDSGMFMETEASRTFRQSRYDEGIARLVGNLVIMNAVTLVAGGGVSYMLARRTLRPIQETVEAQSRFTSDASHELRTPLAIMRSEIEVGLRDTSATKADYRELLRSNLEEVDRLRELSDRLLVLASERDLPLESISLDAAAITAVSHVVKLAQQKAISVVNEVRPEKIRGNQEALSDVVTILLENAVKYSPGKTVVTLTSESKGRSILLHVIDQGPGIAAEDVPYVFDRFYRVDDSRSRQHVEGHGLGLSIARRIVDQHHGELTVKSEVGVGTTFTVRLPRP